MTEPRTRSAIEVADHASSVQEEAHLIHQAGTNLAGSTADRDLLSQSQLTLALVERLAAQVEDLAAVVAEQAEVIEALKDESESFGPDDRTHLHWRDQATSSTETVEIIEPGELDWHGHLLAAYQHLDAVVLGAGTSTPEDIVTSTDTAWRSVKRLLQAISDGEV